MPLISVVIPVYNVEKYLKQCLESVLRQTYQDLEIICINDGSTDNSLCILSEFLQKDSRVLVINQENKGLSAARNTGLKHVTSKYVSFIDSDDYIDPRYIEALYDKLYDSNADFSLCQALPFGDNVQQNLEYDTWRKTRYHSSVPVNPNKIVPNAWSKLFRMNIIQKYRLEFPEGLLAEDNYWNFLYCACSKECAIVHENLYFHRRDNSDSIMSKTIFQEMHRYDVIKVCCRIFDSFEGLDVSQNCYNYLDDFFYGELGFLMKINNKKSIDRPFWNEIREYLMRSKNAEKKFANSKFFNVLDENIWG